MDRLSKAVAISLVLFSVVLAAFIGSRVDQVTIALLGGTFIGLMVAIPSVLLVMVLMTRRREEDRYDRPRYTAHMPPSPPQYWMMPHPADAASDFRVTQLPTQPSPARPVIGAPEYVLPAVRRRFYLIGESGEMQEIGVPHEPANPSDDLPGDQTGL
jgi:hypothetical protein